MGEQGEGFKWAGSKALSNPDKFSHNHIHESTLSHNYQAWIAAVPAAAFPLVYSGSLANLRLLRLGTAALRLNSHVFAFMSWSGSGGFLTILAE